MERVLSPDVKIRRAEEIYFRRSQTNNNVNRIAKVNVENKKKNQYIRKLCIQFIACILIYTGFYTIKNSEDILPKTITDKIHQILQYDINLEVLQGKINNYLVEVNEKFEPKKEENPPDNQVQDSSTVEENSRITRRNFGSNGESYKQ